MKLLLDFQLAIEADALPRLGLLELWIKTTLEAVAEQSGQTLNDTYELTLRAVDKPEIQQLNLNYRHQDKPTNVLSFPFEAPPQVPLPLLGDLIVCHPVVVEEALQQHKPLEAHWAHMVVHGTLHLLGYDHIDDRQAEKMEAREIKTLQQLGYANPYEPSG